MTEEKQALAVIKPSEIQTEQGPVVSFATNPDGTFRLYGKDSILDDRPPPETEDKVRVHALVKPGNQPPYVVVLDVTRAQLRVEGFDITLAMLALAHMR